MSKAVIRRSEQLYALLLQLYPQRYKQQFASEMQFVFVESLKDAYIDRGDQGIIVFWSRTLLDVTKSLIRQHTENIQEGVSMKTTTVDPNSGKVDLRRPVLLTLGVLAIPLLARFPWGVLDFVIMGVLIFATTFGVEFVWKKLDPRYRVVAALIILGAAFLLWAELSVDLVSQILSGEIFTRM